MTHKLREVLPCWTPPTWGDFLAADKFIAMEIARSCKGGITPQYWGYPVAWAIPRVLDLNLLGMYMAPKQVVHTGGPNASPQGPPKQNMPSNAPDGNILKDSPVAAPVRKSGRTAGEKTRDRKARQQEARARDKKALEDVRSEFAAFRKASSGSASGGGGDRGRHNNPPDGEGASGREGGGKGSGKKGGRLPAHLRPGEALTPDGLRKCFDYANGKCDGAPGKQCSKGYWHFCIVPGCNGAHSRIHCRKGQ